MIRSFEYTFKSSVAIVFDHLIHQYPYYDDELKKFIKSYKPIVENDKYLGIEVVVDIDGNILQSEYKISHYEKNVRVQYLDQG